MMCFLKRHYRALTLSVIGLSLSACQHTDSLSSARFVDLDRAQLQQAHRWAAPQLTDLKLQSLKQLHQLGYVEASFALTQVYLTPESALYNEALALEYAQPLLQSAHQQQPQYLRALASVAWQEKAHALTMEGLLKQAPHSAMRLTFYRHNHAHFAEHDLPTMIAKGYQQGELSAYQALSFVNSLADRSQGQDLFDAICQPLLSMESPSRVQPVNLSNQTEQLCFRLGLQLAKINQDHQQVDAWIALIQARFAEGMIDSASLQAYARILMSRNIGQRQLIKAIELLMVDVETSETFLMIAQFESKKKYVLETETLLAQLKKFTAQGETENRAKAAALLAEMYIVGSRVYDDPKLAESILKPFQTQPHIAYQLAKLYLSGKFGRYKVQSAVDLLLYAARNHYQAAYLLLARTFHEPRGITPNYQFAWVFSEAYLKRALALPETAHKTQAKQEIAQLISAEVSQQLTVEELQAAHRLLEKELGYF